MPDMIVLEINKNRSLERKLTRNEDNKMNLLGEKPA